MFAMLPLFYIFLISFGFEINCTDPISGIEYLPTIFSQVNATMHGQSARYQCPRNIRMNMWGMALWA